jgi:hypothetical protein
MNGKKNDEEGMLGGYFWSIVNKNAAPYRAACGGHHLKGLIDERQ